MKEFLNKMWRKLDITINEFRQGVVIIGDDTSEHKEFIQDFRKYLQSKQKVAYIDFNKVADAKTLGIKLLEQYAELFENVPEYDVDGEDYRLLGLALELFSNIEDPQGAVIWLDYFDEVLKMKESDWLLEMLRGIFQHQDNIVHVFTSSSREEVGKIFSNYHNPFYHFAVTVFLTEQKTPRDQS